MRKCSRPLNALLFAVLTLALATTQNKAATQAIKFGKLWDGRSVLSDAVVVVQNDKIMSVTANGVIPEGATTIDLSRYTGLPGFIDAHVHMTFYWDPASGINPALRRQPPRHVAVTVFLSQANALKTLEAGVTTVRDLGASGGGSLAMRELIGMGAMPGPRMFVAGAGLGSSKGLAGVDDFVADAAKRAKERLAEGVDWIKIFASTGTYDNVTGDQTVSYEELKAIIEVAHAAGHKVAVHSYGPAAARDAIRAGADSLEHATDLDDETIAEMVRRGVWYVPTISHNQYYVENLSALKFSAAAQPALENYIARNFATAKKAFQAGARIILGSDAVFSGFGSNMRELSLFVKMGMTNEQALRTATVLPAEMLGMEKQLGSVAPGYFADLVAVEGDPLTEINVAISNVRWVMRSGQVVVDKRTSR